MMLNDIVKNLLKEVSGIAEIPANAAFNIRNNSKSEGRHSTENIDIVPKAVSYTHLTLPTIYSV